MRVLHRSRRHTCICEAIYDHIVNTEIGMQCIATLSHANTSDAEHLELAMGEARIQGGHEEKGANPAQTIMRETECFSTRSLEVGTRRGLASACDVIRYSFTTCVHLGIIFINFYEANRDHKW